MLTLLYKATLLCTFQGHRVAELMLHHAQANECKDVERFKAEMATLVTQARKNIVTLEKVERLCDWSEPCLRRSDALCGEFARKYAFVCLFCFFVFPEVGFL